jgi:hypothetical protein
VARSGLLALLAVGFATPHILLAVDGGQSGKRAACIGDRVLQPGEQFVALLVECRDLVDGVLPKPSRIIRQRFAEFRALNSNSRVDLGDAGLELFSKGPT